MAAHVPEIVACLETENAMRVTPLRVLAAMAAGGESKAVAHAATGAIIKSLDNKLLAVRVAACDAVTALAQSGFADAVLLGGNGSARRPSIGARRNKISASGSAVDKLSRIVKQDSELDAQAASRTALQTLAAHSGHPSFPANKFDSTSESTSPPSRYCSGVRATWNQPSDNSVSPLTQARSARPGSAARGVRLPVFSMHLHGDSDSEEDCEEMSGVTAWLGNASNTGRGNTRPWKTRATYLHVMGNAQGVDDSQMADGEKLWCVICQQKLTRPSASKALSCGHVYHAHCINAWLSARRGKTCPICRHRPSSARQV